MSKEIFKVRALKDDRGYFTKGKIYEFINGICIFDDGTRSWRYDNFQDLLASNSSWSVGNYLEEVTSENFKPIEIRLACICDKKGTTRTRVGMKVDSKESVLNKIKDVKEFFGADFNINIICQNKASFYDEETRTLSIGDEGFGFGSLALFEDNKKAINVMNEIHGAITELNYLLENTEKINKVYAVEHEPDGMRFNFKSKQRLNVGDVVSCDTVRGNVYGIVREVILEPVEEYLNRNECQKVK